MTVKIWQRLYVKFLVPWYSWSTLSAAVARSVEKTRFIILAVWIGHAANSLAPYVAYRFEAFKVQLLKNSSCAMNVQIIHLSFTGKVFELWHLSIPIGHRDNVIWYLATSFFWATWKRSFTLTTKRRLKTSEMAFVWLSWTWGSHFLICHFVSWKGYGSVGVVFEVICLISDRLS